MTVPIASRADGSDLQSIPSVIPNHLGSQDASASDGRTFAKIDPATGRAICQVARSTAADVQRAVEIAKKAQPAWAATTVVGRGDILRQIALLMREHRADLAELVARETGKSRKDALGEADAAIEMGFFVAGEGRRFYGQTTTSAVPNKAAMVVRQPLGVAGLIHRCQHAARERRMEGVSCAAVRECGRHEGGRGHAAVSLGVRCARAGGGRARRRVHDVARFWRRGGCAARRAPPMSPSSALPVRAR